MKHTMRRALALLIALMLALPTFALAEEPAAAVNAADVYFASDEAQEGVMMVGLGEDTEEPAFLPGDVEGESDGEAEAAEETIDLADALGLSVGENLAPAADAGEASPVMEPAEGEDEGTGEAPSGSEAPTAEESAGQPADGEAPAVGESTGEPAEGEAPAGGESAGEPVEGEAPAGGESAGEPVEGEAPAAGESADEPLEGEAPVDGESAGEPSEGEAPAGKESAGEPAEDEGTGEEPSNEAPAAEPTEGEGEEPSEDEPTEGEPSDEDPAPAVQLVRVVFDIAPETASVAVFPLANDEAPEPEPIPAQDDGAWLLAPGEYSYNAAAEGYILLEGIPFAVAEGDETLTLTVALEPIGEPAEEPDEVSAAFEQSRTVGDVTVTVRAEAGAFPAGAELSVKQVPAYTQAYADADAAVEDTRDDDQNVVVSYTFDIKVIDPATGGELQPAEGFTVEVSFALAEAADENLEANVYHVTGTGGDMTAERLDTEVDGSAETVTAVSDGFSLYTVEFTYADLEYVLPGGGRVALSAILDELGLTGAPTAAEVSDESLFSASDATGSWVIESHRPFSSEEWMRVWIDGIPYVITVTDDQQTPEWQALQAAITDAGTAAKTIKVSDYDTDGDKTIKAQDGDGALTISDGQNITLDLNGCTLDRGLKDKDAVDGGRVITVKGTLTVQDSGTGGTITGGNEKYLGGGVYVISGSFTLKGGAITGNTAGTSGGGVNLNGSVTFTMEGGEISSNASGTLGGGVYAQGTFILKDGTITNNTAGTGGGVYVFKDHTFTMEGGEISGNVGWYAGGVYAYGTFTMKGGEITDNTSNIYGGIGMDAKGAFNLQGAVKIIGNKAGSADSNVYLVFRKTITVTGKLENTDPIGVTMEYPGVFTVGLSGNGGAGNFTSDDPDYNVYLTADGGAEFKQNTEWTDLQAAITAAGTAPTTIKVSDYDTNGDGRIIAASTDGALNVAWGQNITLDLDGCTLDRGLKGKTAVNGGCVIRDQGTLTVQDSGTGGIITGGNTNSSGGGVCVMNGNFTLKGGTITGNNGVYGGGGVELDYGAFTMEGGEITGNTTGDGGLGGGVLVSTGTFTMKDGEITDNTAGRSGGGVYVERNTASFTMESGEISRNSAEYGGGVYAAGTFAMEGGTITDNTSSKSGGGISVGEVGTFNLQGAVKITGNKVGGADSNVNLKPGRTIAITDKLENADPIGVTMQTPGVFTGGLSGKGGAGNFTSDDKNYVVSLTDNNEAQLVRLYAVNIDDPIQNGSVSADLSTAYAGQTVTLTVTPDPGCALDTLTVKQGETEIQTAAGANDTYTFTMPAGDVNVSATFSKTSTAPLLATLKPANSTSLNLSWLAYSGADGYDVYFKDCDGEGNYPLVKTLYGGGNTSWTISGLGKKNIYKAYVVAWKDVNGVKTPIATSPDVHAIPGGVKGRKCNAKSVRVSKKSLTLALGKTGKIKAKAKGVKSGKKVLAHVAKLRYISSNTAVATVSGVGRVRAVGVGSCTVYVLANNGVHASVRISVVDQPTKVSFRKSSYSVKAGKSLNLTGRLRLKPTGLTLDPSKCTWTSSNPGIAAVNANGIVTGIRKGTATITLQTANGKKARVKIKVK